MFKRLIVTLFLLTSAFTVCAEETAKQMPETPAKERLQANDNGHWLEAYQDDPELFSFDGYRIQRYRSPTPEQSRYALTLDTQGLQQQLTSQPETLLLDVQPLPWNGTFIHPKERRQHIPGSTWLPNVGLGELDESWAYYYQFHLQRITAGDKHHPIVLYCRADCWMSWNAIQRAAEWGYTQLFWYRDGTDAWLENELETVLAEPIPFPVTGNQ